MVDVLNGECTVVHRLGNQHADRYARQGAEAHPLPANSVGIIESMRALQSEIVRWGAMHDVLMKIRGWADTSGFPGPAEASESKVQPSLQQR
eukprot:6513318-Pyramimonas_sp.AAC.1